MNYDGMQTDILEVFTEVQYWAVERFAADGFRFGRSDAQRLARRVRKDRRTKSVRRELGLPPPAPGPGRPPIETRSIADSQGRVFHTIRAAVLGTGCDKGSIWRVLKGQRKSAKGLSFRYVGN